MGVFDSGTHLNTHAMRGCFRDFWVSRGKLPIFYANLHIFLLWSCVLLTNVSGTRFMENLCAL